jgi:hypothetical protein
MGVAAFAGMLDAPDLLARHPKLAAYFGRVTAHPAVARCWASCRRRSRRVRCRRGEKRHLAMAGAAFFYSQRTSWAGTSGWEAASTFTQSSIRVECR